MIPGFRFPCTPARLQVLALVIVGSQATQGNALPQADPQVTEPHDLGACWDLLREKRNDDCARCIGQAERRLKQAVVDDSTWMNFHTLKGYHAFSTGDRASAEEQMLLARSEFLAAGGNWKLGRRIYRVLAHMAYEQGDYHRALEHYRDLLALITEHDPEDIKDIGHEHYNIGNCFWGMDQRDSCRAHYATVLSLWRAGDESGDPVIGYIHEVLGTYAWEEGDERGALEHFNKAAALQLKDAGSGDEADRMIHAAEGEAMGGRNDEALRLYQQALDFRVKNYGAGHPNTACMHSDIARMLATMDRSEEAMDRVQQAIALFLPGFDPADAWTNPAGIDSVTSHRLLLDALLLKFRLLTARPGDPRTAQAIGELIDLALLTIERLRIGAAAEESKLFWTTHLRGFFEEALTQCHEQFQATNDMRSIERAMNIMELSRNALLAEALRSLDALYTGGLPAGLADEERALRQRIIEMRRYTLLEERKCDRMDADKVGLWKKATSAAEAELDRLVKQIAVEYPGYHDLKYGSSFIRLDEIRARLGSQRSLLCMFQGTTSCHFLRFDARGAEFVRRDGATTIEEAATSLREVLADRGRSLADPQGTYLAFVEHAGSLYNTVFGGFSEQPLQRLVIMPDGIFQYLPFEVLLTAPPNASTRDYRSLPYLIKDHAVQYTPMIRLWLRQSGKDQRTGTYLGMAPRYEEGGPGGFAPLRSNEQEVEAVRSLLGGEVFTVREATERNFKQYAPEAGVIHLAMHTVLDDVDPLSTAFAFSSSDTAEDGLLNMYELFGLKLRARLAVLSACGTGDGKMLHGEGIMSMARAFAYAGCPSIAMSLWNCEDDATRAIVTAFFTAARMSVPLDAALRTAKLRYLDTCDPAKAHPYYWSTMVLVGDERAIDLSDPWYRRAWVWFTLASLLGLVLAWSRIRKLF